MKRLIHDAMNRSMRVTSPPAVRLADGRPVLTRAQVTELTKRIMDMTTAPTAKVTVTHTANYVTRMANNQVLSGDDGDTLTIRLGTSFDSYDGGSRFTVARTNQLDDNVLHTIVKQCEQVNRAHTRLVDDIDPDKDQVPDTLVPVNLWHETTVRAMTTTRGKVIPELLMAVTRERFNASGFLGFMVRSEAYATKDGISVYNEETDSEVTVTARTLDGKSSGWSGQAARDWSTVKYAEVATRAIDFAKRSANPVALEPGRRTAILSSTAVAQIMQIMAQEFSAGLTFGGGTGFSRQPRGHKLFQRVFDERISMRSDPADSDGGYRPYFSEGGYTDEGLGTPAMSWVENGILKNLQYGVREAMTHGKAYSEPPYSIRVSGGTTSVEEMIAQCKEGIYVNRFSNVDLVDLRSGMTTGVTRDGCFFVKNGKIEKAVKNFRFLDSPFFFLNKIEALGAPERVAFGYTLGVSMGSSGNAPTDWPRRPIIAPPMMVRDFNFSALSDAV